MRIPLSIALIGAFGVLIIHSHAQEMSANVTERSKEAPTGWFAGAGVGFTHVQWKTPQKVLVDGLSIDLRGGYLCGFRSGMVLGGELFCSFFPSMTHEMNGGGQIALGKISTSVTGLLGTFFPSLKGILGTSVGFTHTSMERTEANQNKREKFNSFHPEIGIFYMTNVWSTVYVRIDGRYALNIKSGQIKANRLMIVLNMVYLF